MPHLSLKNCTTQNNISTKRGGEPDQKWRHNLPTSITAALTRNRYPLLLTPRKSCKQEEHMCTDRQHAVSYMGIRTRQQIIRLTSVLEAAKNRVHEERVRYSPYTIPEMKMALKFQLLGVGLDTTRSLDRAIMAPSLNTAKSTIRRVGKYLQLQLVCQPKSPA